MTERPRWRQPAEGEQPPIGRTDPDDDDDDAAVPAFLTAQPRWVLWREETRRHPKTGDVTKTKPPISWHTSKKCDVSDPTSWVEFKKVAAAVENSDAFDGYGFALGGIDHLAEIVIGLDADTCLDDNGNPTEWVLPFLAALPSYAEISPGGHGIKIPARIRLADFPEARRLLDIPEGDKDQARTRIFGERINGQHAPSVQLFLSGRYFTITGNHWPTSPEEVRLLSLEQIAQLAALFGPKQQRTGDDRQRAAADDDDTEPDEAAIRDKLARALRRNPRLKARWEGGTEGLNDTTRSGRDMSIVGLLVSAGFTKGEVRAALRDWFHHGKVADEPERYFERMWASTKAEPPQPRPEPPLSDGAGAFGQEEGDGEYGQADAEPQPGAGAQKRLSGLDIWNAGRDDYIIPPREWLLGNSLCKRFLSSLIGDGAVGKTALRIAQLLSLATGRSLTGEHVFRRCRCLIISLEDDRDELRRRVYAAMLYYGIKAADVDGWLFLAAPKGLKLAKMTDGSPEIGVLEKLLRDAIAGSGIDIASLDPFVKAHSVGENDNNAIDFVCDLLAAIAIDLNCAIDFPSHTNKGTAIPGDANRMRGASAAKNAGRLVYTATTMTTEEAEQFGVSEAERRSLIRIDPAKVNIAPPSAEAKWLRLVGQSLGNETPEYPKGDEVQTVEPWAPPDTWADLDSLLLNRVLDTIDAGMTNGQRYSAAAAAGKRAAWLVVQEHSPQKPEKACRAIINTWIKNGLLFSEDHRDPVQRRDVPGHRVNPNKRPT